jgi:hypothetical protein
MHLRYHREEELYGKLRQVFEDTRQQYAAFVEKTKRHEQGFLECLGNAVRINGFPGMPELIETVGKRLRQELNLDLFVHQSPVATAHCRLRDAPSSGSEGGRLVIMVSQHFLNDLTDTEQASIIGHELGHLLFKHIHIPARAILESDLPMSAVGDLKSNVMRWMICTEVSCDMLGLISSDGDPDAFSTAMLKYTTGINRQCLQQNPEQLPMVRLMLEQFDEITSAVAGAPLSTHPLTPLRVKIANTIARSDLLSHYGQNIDRASIDRFRRDFQKLLDAEVTKVYPEIVSSERQLNRLGTGVLHLCTAVAQSDGKDHA